MNLDKNRVILNLEQEDNTEPSQSILYHLLFKIRHYFN